MLLRALRPAVTDLFASSRQARSRALISVLGPDREQVLGACIQDVYLKPERPQLADLFWRLGGGSANSN